MRMVTILRTVREGATESEVKKFVKFIMKNLSKKLVPQRWGLKKPTLLDKIK